MSEVEMWVYEVDAIDNWTGWSSFDQAIDNAGRSC